MVNSEAVLPVYGYKCLQLPMLFFWHWVMMVGETDKRNNLLWFMHVQKVKSSTVEFWTHLRDIAWTWYNNIQDTGLGTHNSKINTIKHIYFNVTSVYSHHIPITFPSYSHHIPTYSHHIPTYSHHFENHIPIISRSFLTTSCAMTGVAQEPEAVRRCRRPSRTSRELREELPEVGGEWCSGVYISCLCTMW